MIDELGGALRAGGRCLLDPAVWLGLARAVFSLAFLARLVGWIVVVVVGAFAGLLVHGMAGRILSWVVGFAIALWLLPLAARRGGAIVAGRAVAARPGAASMASRPLPPAASYRAWWLPLILCDTALPPLLDWLDIGDHDLLMALALPAVAAVAPGAIVRTVLAPWFAVADVDRDLAARRVFWALVGLAWIIALGVLHAIVIFVAGASAVQALVSAILSADFSELASALLLRGILFCVAFLAASIFCTGALTWFAARALAGDDVRPAVAPGPGPTHGPAADAPPAAPTRPVQTAQALAARRREWADVLAARPVPARASRPARPAPPPLPPRPAPTPEQRKAARTQALRQGALLLVVVAGALYGARDFVTPWFLGSQFREAVDRHGDWLDLGVRQQVRTDMACLGRTKTLRVLSWLGVEGRASPRDAALGCAAFHGQVDAVETLVALGEDIDRPADAIDSPLPVALQTPLQQAVRAPAGLPAAEWLLAHGAKPRPAAAVADPVQTAAAANCLACIEWLRQHGLPMDGAEPATPLALWLDRPASQGGADVATVTRLIGLGMSPSAIGADGRSALHAAAAAGNGPVVELLLARGADPALADHDGMTPLFYAAAGLGRDQGAGADAHERRLAVVLRLLAATPSLAGQGVPAPAHSHPVIAADPYIHQPYDFDLTAAAEPRIRAAADEAGKTIHYTDGAFLEGLPAPEARALLARMVDADIARVMAPGASFAAFAAKAGWWPELLRGVRGWAPSTSHADYRWRPDCEVLRAAVEGPGDASPGRADSWAVVDAWLDAGMRPSDCNAGTGSVPSALARRPPAQQADWAARTGSGGSSARP